MKTFKQLIAEVAQPNNEDELNFKEKHSIEVIDHPASKEHQHSAEKKSPKRRADYNPGEDEEVYEAKLDPVGKEDDDKPVRIKLRGWGPDQKKGNMGNPAARASLMKKEAKLDPVGKEDDDIDNDGDVDSSDEYLHARRKAIAKAMKKEASTSPYAIGMASAMKQTGDKPPLKKSTITKAHKIAKSIMKNESLDEVSKEKLKNYINAARKDMVIRYYDDSPESDKKYFNRAKGIKKALDKRGANPKAKVPATESYELSENFKAGSVKLNDGSSVILKDQDAKLMNQLFADLNSDNKKKMMKVAMTDKNGFNEILGFAREAL